MEVTRINRQLINQTSLKAGKAERKRINYNFHKPEDHAQRMLNAIEPDSYIRPHRHINPGRDEAFLILRGRGVVLIFDESGELSEQVLLDPKENCFGVDIPGGFYHSVIALEKETVFYEVKPGPYNPALDKGFASWAPEEGTVEAKSYLTELKEKLIFK